MIVLIARTGAQDKARALALVAAAYFTKPVGLAELLAQVRTTLPQPNP